MNSKMMALIIGGLLCGLTAFGQRDYLYDSRGLRYDLGNASYTSFGNSMCVYDVDVTLCYETNAFFGSAVILYDGTYGTMKIFRVNRSSSVLPPEIYGIETRYTGSAGSFSGKYCDGSTLTLPIDLSFEPIYPLPTLSGPPVLNAGSVSGGESVLSPDLRLSAEEDLGIPKGSIYRFTATAAPYSFIFYVFSNEVLNFFPLPGGGYNPTALAMSVDVYYNNTEITTTSGIFYAFQVSSYQFRTYFTVFPNSAFPASLSILANYFSVRSQNQISVFTLAQDAAITMTFLGD